MASKKSRPFNKSGLYRALMVTDGASEMARLLTSKTDEPITRQRVFQWKKYGNIPREFVVPIYEITHIPIVDLLEEFEPVKAKDK